MCVCSRPQFSVPPPASQDSFLSLTFVGLYFSKRSSPFMFFLFFFQAEDGIRDHCVTGVQTCALPISLGSCASSRPARRRGNVPRTSRPTSIPGHARTRNAPSSGVTHMRSILLILCGEIGRASCRERV